MTVHIVVNTMILFNGWSTLASRHFDNETVLRLND